MPGLINSVLILFLVFLVSFKEKITLTPSIKESADLNTIEFSDSSLVNFKLKIDSLKKGLRKKIKIVHIGDSHIQADYFTCEIRKRLQSELGNGGRGLIFPYAIAKTNGPGNYFKSTAEEWQPSRNVMYPHKFPIGLCGISLQHSGPGNMNLNFSKDSAISDSNNVLLIYTKSKGAELFINKKRKKSDDQLQKLYDTLSYSTTGKINIELEWKQKGEFYFHGAYLENYSPGLIYNMIGVNGACYKDYSSTEYFYDQLPILQPDLIIISLGTNESYAPKYSETIFDSDVNLFLIRLKQICPNADIILSSASENFFKKKNKLGENNRVASVNKVLRKQALEKKLAFWDFYKIMGGKNSMRTWRKNNLAGPDHVHFTRKGYSLQGQLFSAALLKALQ